MEWFENPGDVAKPVHFYLPFICTNDGKGGERKLKEK
jgi:hypothetical protein